ncbi:MAG: type II toxin-antitoxin system prevent-host-death family antitoxin [Myxococcales bacterium]|nr:type II toxin-antitoxin system prevent-host-death family antitoxin [Myxococcales bacterium]
MRSTSLVSAKAHLSELVDEAEHRGRRILILRHGKPAAAIVPVAVARGGQSATEGRQVLTAAEAERRLDELEAEMRGDPGVSAVEDLIEGRR